LVWAVLLVMGLGCSSRVPNPDTADVVFLVPGAGGYGKHYDRLVRGMRAGGVEERIEVLHWGVRGPLFFLNFQDVGIHQRAETKLAAALADWRERHPDGRVSVVAHSAGCGVTLGALALPEAAEVDAVVLLNPSVSPEYDLAPALSKIRRELHVFHSDRDDLYLSWRTGTFGTYDNVKTRAAGNVGFSGIEALPPELGAKVVQHGREPSWRRLGNNGRHFGTCAPRFAAQTIAPLLDFTPGRSGRSFAATSH
jgi:pimeloyl-ACP methyl ester carboxylesterase